MSKEERRIVSYHETGHALISALQKNSEPVQKITIVPRTMGALGYVMQVPEEEKYLNTQAELHDMLVGLLGGRAAEEIVFDTVTTGASNDIEKATNIARAMVTQYGMSKRFGLMGLETVESKYLDGRTAMNCSDVTAAAVDEEVMKILKESYKEAKKLLKENRALMDKLAEHLIEKETITGKEFMKIYRAEKGLPEPEEKPKEQIKAERADAAGAARVQPEGAVENQSGSAWQNAGMQDGVPMGGNMSDYEREQLMRNAWPQIRGLGGNDTQPGAETQEDAGSTDIPGAESQNTAVQGVDVSDSDGKNTDMQSTAVQDEDGKDSPSAKEEVQDISSKVENEFAEALRNRMYARKEEQNTGNGEQNK